MSPQQIEAAQRCISAMERQQQLGEAIMAEVEATGFISIETINAMNAAKQDFDREARGLHDLG